VRKLLGVLALSISATAVAYADPYIPTPPSSPPSQSTAQQWDSWWDSLEGEFGSWVGQLENTFWSYWSLTDPDQGQGSGTVSAPELDPAGMLAALTLLSGGLAVIRGRKTRR
jgi:hypothetical protein